VTAFVLVQLFSLAVQEQQWQYAFPYTGMRAPAVDRAVFMQVCWDG